MIQFMSRDPSIDRISLQRLLNSPEDYLRREELEHFFSRVEAMDLELLLNIIAMHPTLSRDPRVVTALVGHAPVMDRRQLGLSLRRCPALVAAEPVITAFHTLLERDAASGVSPRSLAEELAQRLGADIYPTLVERAFSDDGNESDAALQFRLVLHLMQASAPPRRARPIDSQRLLIPRRFAPRRSERTPNAQKLERSWPS